MTGRTHDLAALTALLVAFLFFPIPTISTGTLLFCIGSNMLGGLAPDLDQPTADIWRKMRLGKIMGTLLAPLLGGHRLISHSILGTILIGILLNKLLNWMSSFILVDMSVVWWSFMIGYGSHLATDAVTKQGIPLFFPLPFSIGFPPVKKLRIKSGAFVEKALVYPGLILLNGWLVYRHYDYLYVFLTTQLTK